jgi:hypothetical protein
MPKVYDAYTYNAQPMNWGRAFLSGVCASLIFMSFIDVFYMLGVTPFNMEVYVGSLLRDSLTGTHNWTAGFFANLVIGGLFGLLYGFFFEDVFKRSGSRVGIWAGFIHAFFAMIAVFPFFNIVAQQMNIELYPNFGVFGLGLGPATPLVLLLAHLLFGVTMGMFYGPVRMDRLRSKFMEPEDTQQENTDAA